MDFFDQLGNDLRKVKSNQLLLMLVINPDEYIDCGQATGPEGNVRRFSVAIFCLSIMR